MTAYEGVPGLVETVEARGETTLVVDPARILDACLHLRDEQGFNFLSDIAPADYLGWGGEGVAGYIGTPSGRDLTTRPQGLARSRPEAARFVGFHLLRLSGTRPRPVQAWLDDGEEIDSGSRWPTTDWFERRRGTCSDPSATRTSRI